MLIKRIFLILAFGAFSHATSPAALARQSGSVSAVKERSHADLFERVRIFEEDSEREHLAPHATLELLDLLKSDPERRRFWRDVPGSGVISERRLLSMRILRVTSGRASVEAKTRVTVVGYDKGGDLRPLEKPRTLSDRLELTRSGQNWLIISVARRIR